MPAPCTLDIMLEARDRRRELQMQHFSSDKKETLVVATVVSPGLYKLTERTAIVAKAERQCLKNAFEKDIKEWREYDLPSGHETWLVIDCTAEEAKQKTVDIEEHHPLGRLFDIDVILPGPTPMTRGEIGLPQRRCLICSNEARECMRARRHTTDEIAAYINNLIDKYASQ